MQLMLFIVFIFYCNCIFAEDDEIFVPTKEWQVVRKGQKIPQGLHVRMDLSTGITQAKLLDENEEIDSKSQGLISLPNQESESLPDQQNFKSDLNKKFANLHVDSLTKEDRDTIKNNYRSYEEIKKTLDEINIKAKLDSEIIHDLISEHKETLKIPNLHESKMLAIIEDLDFLLHKIDNAVEFVNQNGFEKVIYKNLNSTNINIKEATLKLLSTVMQNNNKPKIHALETGAMRVILKSVVDEKSDIIRLRALSALSSFLRSFPVAQKSFIGIGGFSMLTKIFDTKDVKSQVKIVTLLSDLMIEHSFALNDLNLQVYYMNMNWNSHLQDHDWCENINKLLTTLVKVDANDHDSIEKCLVGMNTVKKTCGSQYNKYLLIKIRSHYTDLMKNEDRSSDFNNSDYFKVLKQICDDIIEEIGQIKKSEL